jgi:hypothetical protein
MNSEASDVRAFRDGSILLEFSSSQEIRSSAFNPLVLVFQEELSPIAQLRVRPFRRFSA